MELIINGKATTASAQSLELLLDELGYAHAKIATAVNGDIVHRGDRQSTRLKEGDAIEIVAPMQGG